MPSPSDLDTRIRLAAFSFLEEQTKLLGDELSRDLLLKGFIFDGHRVPLLGPQGIFKPALMQLPLSLFTAPQEPGKKRPYEDGFDDSDRVLYCYRGTDPQHRDNVGLRQCMQQQKPLIYIAGIAPSLYMVAGPAFIVNDDPQRLVFTVQVDDRSILRMPHDATTAGEIALRRHYVTTQVQQRLHQRSFRERVLQAYQKQCVLLGWGEPVVSNGLALCNLHHAAYDSNILGVTPDLKVEVRLDVLQEKDGPMLEWGLQKFHGAELIPPRRALDRPNPDYLAERYAIFQRAY
jgi:putative restriction endonuclease